MLIVHLIIILSISFEALAASKESELLKKCGPKDLDACLELTAQFIKSSRWSDAYAMGDALCKKDVLKGCTYAGTAAILKGSAKVGFDLLSKACDGFEPFACQSLADIAKKTHEEKMRYMYQKRACYNGLSESCKDLSKPTNLYSSHGQEFYKKILADCEITNSASCKAELQNLTKCPAPLTKEDCFLIPGDLSIVFRAKLIQDVGKLTLLKILAAQKNYKATKKRFTYDLSSLMHDKKEFLSSKYVFGFQVACTKKFENQKAQSTSMGASPHTYQNLSDQTKRNILATFKKEKGDDCYDPSLGFEAYAVGKLDPLNPNEVDVWKINNNGDIIQIQNGLP
jgi:hypothetical protein